MSEKSILAIPAIGEGGLEGERSGHFGHADSFTLIEIAEGAVTGVTVLPNPPHEHGGCLRPVQLLADAGVDALVVAGMGARPFAGFRDAGIKVYFESETPRIGDVVQMVVAGTLQPMDERAVCGGGGNCHH